MIDVQDLAKIIIERYELNRDLDMKDKVYLITKRSNVNSWRYWICSKNRFVYWSKGRRTLLYT